ncbi:MAG TPA: glycosyltransferase family 39 protein [Anaerolineae bacterium]|nr:glycosyltransferase family 39 protein [Anaerolineae bacterium]HQK14898.1 glycosyltransferase family 39 protein [Anaerolineae bacterium]
MRRALFPVPSAVSPTCRLILLLALFLILGISYACVTPLFENPDESSHLQVIRYFAEERRLYAPVTPTLHVATGADMAIAMRPHTPPRYYTPPFYHAVAALIIGHIHIDDLDRRLVPNPAWEAGWSPQRNADPWNKNVYVHLPGETWATSATFRATLILRLCSLGLSLVTIICTYHIARRLRPTQSTFAFGAAACVALNPQFIALSAGVTNDPLLIAIVSFALLLALRFMEQQAHQTRWAALGALVGIGMLTKQSALLLLPIGGLAILGQTPPRAPLPWKKIFADGFAFGGTALLVGGWWYLHNALRYGDLLGMWPHFESQTPLRSFGWSEIRAIFETYWGGFGWALLSLPGWVYALLAGMVALAAMGIVRALWRGELRHFSPPARRSLGILTFLLLMNGLALVRWSVATGAPYGRLLFPACTSIGVLLAWGWEQWRGMGLRFITAMLAVLAMLVPWVLLRPAFASPHYPDALPRTATPVAVTFDEAITLLAYAAPQHDLHPGDTLPITFYWRAEQAPAQRYNVWVQLSPSDPTRRIAESHRWLGGTLYPGDLWRAGDVIRETCTLKLPTAMPAPGLYWVRLGLTDETGKRIPFGDAADMLSLGPWRVRAKSLPASPEHAVAYAVGEQIMLRGYTVTLRESLTVTLTWAARARPLQDYTVFVHLVGADGNIIAQHDGPPYQGNYPTSWWLPGDIIPDGHTLPISAPLPEGALLRVGMYDPITLSRLPVYDTHGTRLPDDIVPLVVSP